MMKIILIIIIILLIILLTYFYFQLQQAGRICAPKPAIDDLLWILENQGLGNRIEKIECQNEQTGFKIR